MVVFDSTARRSSSSSWSAIRCLFAVTTGMPRRRAVRTGSSIASPPASSTSRSTSEACATAIGSVPTWMPVSSHSRRLPGSRTAPRETLTGAPTESRIRRSRSRSSFRKPWPPTPQPRRPMRTIEGGIAPQATEGVWGCLRGKPAELVVAPGNGPALAEGLEREVGIHAPELPRGARDAAERFLAPRLAPFDVAVQELVPGIRLVGFLEVLLRVLLEVIQLPGAHLIHEVQVLAAHPDHHLRIGLEVARELVHHLGDRGAASEEALRVGRRDLVVGFPAPREPALRLLVRFRRFADEGRLPEEAQRHI